jgi:hypothetical protein
MKKRIGNWFLLPSNNLEVKPTKFHHQIKRLLKKMVLEETIEKLEK